MPGEEQNTDTGDTTTVVDEGTASSTGSQDAGKNDTLLGQDDKSSTSADAGESGDVNTDTGDQSGDTANGDTDKGDDKGEGDDTGADESASTEVNYDEIVVPEGFEFDIESYKEDFESQKFTQEQIQYLIDRRTQDAKKEFESDESAFSEMQETQRDAARDDAEYGGADFEKNLSHANKALTAFGTPELTDMLQKSGTGNHPEVIRYMVRVGKAMSEDSLVAPEGGYGTGGPKPSREAVMYPGMIGADE